MPEILKSIAEVIMRLSVVRLDIERLLKTPNGFIQLAKSLERDTEVIVRLSIVRLDIERPLIALYCSI